MPCQPKPTWENNWKQTLPKNNRIDGEEGVCLEGPQGNWLGTVFRSLSFGEPKLLDHHHYGQYN